MTDSFGTTRFAYDADQQLITLTDPAGGITRQSYDSSGPARLDSRTRPARSRSSRWNALDKLVEVMTAANGST